MSNVETIVKMDIFYLIEIHLAFILLKSDNFCFYNKKSFRQNQ
jgi:hypothetical protein